MPTAFPTTRARDGGPAAAPAGPRVPRPVRERRPALLALGLVLIVGGALGSALVVHRSGDRVDVLVVRDDVAPGQQLSAADFGTARVAADGGATVPAAARDNFVGTYATTRIPADTLVNRTMFLAGDTVPGGAAVVGVVLDPEQRPGAPLAAGDVVRAYLVAADGAGTVSGQPAGSVLLDAARVVAAGPAGATGATGAQTAAQTAPGAVSLLVPAGEAGAVVAAAAAGQVALARLADGTVPPVDLVRE